MSTPIRLRSGIAVVFAACALLAACGSSQGGGEREEPSPLTGTTQSRRGVPPRVVGTTLDAASGQPVAGVLIEGPGGTQAVSDADGRFEITGLARGTTGTLSASLDDGRSGSVRLRALVGGELEVVLHLRSPSD